MTGIWNARPKAKISVMISERYSSTFGSSRIVASPGCPICCSETENWISSGIARK
ncbi:hypothetical protein CHKEEEPN_4439 [Methylorubrum podarium]|nr:hypothetical protein CHKEEEPN_4439 [Methylorubrum podarium]